MSIPTSYAHVYRSSRAVSCYMTQWEELMGPMFPSMFAEAHHVLLDAQMLHKAPKNGGFWHSGLSQHSCPPSPAVTPINPLSMLP